MAESIIHLASGRTVVADETPEQVQLLAPDGTVEVVIDLSTGSPRIRLSAASLQLVVDGELTLDAERISLSAREGIDLQTQGEVNMHADEDVRVTGKTIHLN